jgi:hypothetical protein
MVGGGSDGGDHSRGVGSIRDCGDNGCDGVRWWWW